MSLLIKNGRIITATDEYVADIFVEGETIKALGKDLPIKAGTTIDASGLLVFSRGIDPHVHLDMPFMGTFSSDTHETGTRAALFGGTTTVIDFVLQKQGNSLKEALVEWQSRADGTAVSDYSFHVAVTDFTEKTKAEIQGMIDNEGITSFKTFMAYKRALIIDDSQMGGLMPEVKKQGGMVTVHATNALGGYQPGPSSGSCHRSLSVYVGTKTDGENRFFEDSEWAQMKGKWTFTLHSTFITLN